MKKTLFKILILLMASVMLFGCFAGCDVITTDSRKDMAQVVAEVNIGKDKEELKSTFKGLFEEDFTLTDDNVNKILATDAEVGKLDLISYFINYGYNYVQNGYSYADTFELLINSLTSRQMVIQFATLYYLNAGKVVVDADSVPGSSSTDGTVIIVDNITVADYLKKAEEGEVEALKYLLSEDNYNLALYTLRKSVNSALDSYEKVIIKEENNNNSSSTADRTIPTGADTEDENKYPTTAAGALNYQIYTGYNTAEDCGDYEKLDDSTVLTRKKAYNKFIKSLESNYMLEKGEDISKVEELKYFDTEIKNQLEQMIINNFYDTLLISRTDAIEQKDLENKYKEIYDGQVSVFDKSVSEYTTALDKVADNNFILYSPVSGFGFVYNILLPFNKTQSDLLKNAQTAFGSKFASDPDYYIRRNELLTDITTTDQRSSWFNGTTDYSYKAEAGNYYGNSGYLFFEDAKEIDKYYGQYSYNGTVTEKDDDSYSLKPTKMNVDEFIVEMENYLGFVLNTTVTKTPIGYQEDNILDTNGKVDYSKFIYYENKLDFGSTTNDNYLAKGSASYKALSAMNELQFAYTTDTGILNKYFGYSVAGKGYATSYVKEFEYAAQYALGKGAGTMVMCATDYGWHLIYVAFAYNEGTTFAGYNHAEKNVEGTFSNLFYNAYKDVIAENYANTKQNEITTILKDASVKVYESRYRDLATLDL